MNTNKKTSKMQLMKMATVREYKVHINRNELRWKKRSWSMKKMKQVLDSIFMFSTAKCILSAPLPPLRARPGPNMEQSAAIVIQRSPKAMPNVVVLRYPS